MHRKNKKIKAILLGDGPLKQEMQLLVEVSGLSEILIFAGKHPYPGDYLRQADLLLATSNVEGMPNAILEAQVMACPLVATAAGGTQEALEPELHNRLAAPGDETTLENLAVEALRNLSDYKQLMLLVQARILSRRSVKNLAIQTINLREQNLWQPRT
ncbi:MAG: glycosyltransferase [Rheinheimera sp.]|nr:glycosyltransferase [Rheinheimera sp.]